MKALKSLGALGTLAAIPICLYFFLSPVTFWERLLTIAICGTTFFAELFFVLWVYVKEK